MVPLWSQEEALRIHDQKAWVMLQKGQAALEQGEVQVGLSQNDLSNGNHHTFEDDLSIVAALKTCSVLKDLRKGSTLHASVLKDGLLKENIFIGNSLINLYAKCGAISRSRQVFEELPSHDIVSWNALISGYAQFGRCNDAIYSFQRMQQEGLSPDAVTFSSILKSCGNIRATDKGKEIHTGIFTQGLLKDNIVLGNALVDMYAKCRALEKAQQVFTELPIHDVISWNSLIAGYCLEKQAAKAMECVKEMKTKGLSPDAVTFGCIMRACGMTGATEKGEEVHAEALSKRFLEDNALLGNAVVDMYAKCGALAKAQAALDHIPGRNVVSWNTIITGYCSHGREEEALGCLERMNQEGIFPDAITFGCILKACGTKKRAEKGMEVHAEILRKGLLGNGFVLGNALVDMYSKCDALGMAQDVFDELPVRDIVSWTTIIAGYCQHGHDEEALGYFEWMKGEGFCPDAVTFACVLKACGGIGATEQGRQLHSEIVRKGFLANDTLLGGALVDMYANCGILTKAQEVFDKLPIQDAISWTALMTGYCEHGYGVKALHCFEKMNGLGLSPDAVTLGCVLKACGSIGAADKGQVYFETMRESYGIGPTLEHHSSMVDVFGRAGNFKEAMTVIKKMPMCNHLPAWFSLLSACLQWGNVKLGRVAFENALQLDEKSAAAYVVMREIYVAAGMQEDADKIEGLRAERSMPQGGVSLEAR